MKTLIKLLQLNHFNRTLKHFYTWTTGASVDYSIFKTSLCFYFKQFGHHQNQPSFTKLSLHLHVFRLNFRQQCVRRRQQPPQNNWGETFSFSFWCPFRSARSSDRGASDSVQIQGQLNVCHKKKPKSENSPVLSETAARTRADLSEKTPPPWFIWIWIQTRSFCSSDQKRNMTYFLKIIKLSHRFTDQRRWMFLRVVMRLLLLFSHRLQTNNIGVLMRHWVSVRPSVTHWVQNIYILGESEKGREWRGPPKPWRDISGGQN